MVTWKTKSQIEREKFEAKEKRILEKIEMRKEKMEEEIKSGKQAVLI